MLFLALYRGIARIDVSRSLRLRANFRRRLSYVSALEIETSDCMCSADPVRQVSCKARQNRLQTALDQHVQPWLVNRHHTRMQPAYLELVLVDANDLVAEIRKAAPDTRPT